MVQVSLKKFYKLPRMKIMKWQALKSKKLPTVLKNLIVAEILLYLVFMSLALSADWGKLYEGFILGRYVRFEVVEFSLLGLFQLGLIVFIFAKSVTEKRDFNEMMASGEHEKLEFKSALRWDTKRQHVNKELEKTIMKTVAAFLNSDGGYLMIGVDDQGKPIGLEKDFISLPKPNADGFENHFNNLFNQMIGPEFRRLVQLVFKNLDGQTVCLINIKPGHKPAYLKTVDGEDFYIRTGNATTPLKMSEVATYISSWWQK